MTVALGEPRIVRRAQPGQQVGHRVVQAEPDIGGRRSSLGTGSPRSRQAAWSESTMWPAESISVPSQSNTSRSNRFPIQSSNAGWGPASSRVDRTGLQFRGQRRFQGDGCRRGRVLEPDACGVQEHALQAAARRASC